MHRIHAFLFVLVACLAISSTGEAQIYSWLDANGTLVISNESLPPDARTLIAGGTTSMGTPVTATRDGAGRYDALIRRHASNYGVRADLVRAVIQVESGFNPRARSPKGAVGLMQLMPTTAAALGVADRYDPAENIRGGVAYLSRLLRQYEGNEELALAAYNAGPQAVARYGNDVPPYRETRDYVRRVRTITLGTITRSKTPIYKSLDIVNGRPIPRYSNVTPRAGESLTTAGQE